jgi:hypothetical protein
MREMRLDNIWQKDSSRLALMELRKIRDHTWVACKALETKGCSGASIHSLVEEAYERVITGIEFLLYDDTETKRRKYKWDD